MGFPCGSDGKESVCNIGGLSLGWEDPLEKGMATVLLPGEFHGQDSLAGYCPWCHRVGHPNPTRAYMN